ncbi:hypothetical protein HaLaN_07611 [Haematococcus lacustris]|uniref:Uncharacterized protein n=1 Tax=Haematococcus lacustris TaxID=44745 RepID=A0A699YZF3_HAELA|nr:hypothetical protein HaLaN_07611 [Haematococcus lacustris]
MARAAGAALLQPLALPAGTLPQGTPLPCGLLRVVRSSCLEGGGGRRKLIRFNQQPARNGHVRPGAASWRYTPLGSRTSRPCPQACQLLLLTPSMPATAADPSKAHRARASVGHRWCLDEP